MGADSKFLNEHQQRRLRVTCEHIDWLLSDMEATLNATVSKSPFPKYIANVPPSQRRLIEDYIVRMRAQLVRVLKGQQIDLPAPAIPASRSLYTTLTFVHIDIEELKPQYMRGYGELPESLAHELNGIVGELENLVQKLNELLSQQSAQNLQDRLRRLEQDGTDAHPLAALERLVSKHGLVEYRSVLTMILDRLEDKSFEIAVFGRVSSGKSSLLNAVLGTYVLPVGVTPITAVPTRIAYSENAAVTVWFADKSPKQFSLSELSEFVTEQRNPGNDRHVSRVLVHLSSAQLREGIVLVDTPGLGSLAISGAAETRAYMPHCDLGAVLIDAASSITPDDLQTIQALYEIGTPAIVLLSKADLLNPGDATRLLAYTRRQIASALGVDIPVSPVSTLPSHRELLNQWFESAIRPLYARSQDLKLASLRTKVCSLRRSILTALSSQLHRAGTVAQDKKRLEDAETQLRHATARLQEAQGTLRRVREDLQRDARKYLELLSRSVAEQWRKNEYGIPVPDVPSLAHSVVHDRAAMVEEYLRSLVTESVETLARIGEILGSADRPTGEEFRSFVREMPVFEFPVPKSAILRPKLAFLGKRHVEREIAAQLEKRIGISFVQGVATYAALLQAWVDGVLKQIRARFELRAESYRAQLERCLTARQITPEALAELQRDLAALGMNENANATVESR